MESITQSRDQTAHSWLPALWIGIFAGPVAWACDEVIGYSITAHECSTDSMRGLHFLTVASFCLCILGGLCARSGRPDASADGTRAERQRIMAIAGMVLSIGFAVAILATGIPKWMLSPCD